jgi:thiol-disulfide isomerase/thioredoxin
MKKVFKFEASWCHPCQMLSKAFEEIKTDIPVEVIDIDENMDYTKARGVRGVPTLIMMDGDTEVKRKTGSMSTKELEAWLND